jgi:hypothetical protein
MREREDICQQFEMGFLASGDHVPDCNSRGLLVGKMDEFAKERRIGKDVSSCVPDNKLRPVEVTGFRVQHVSLATGQ